MMGLMVREEAARERVEGMVGLAERLLVKFGGFVEVRGEDRLGDLVVMIDDFSAETNAILRRSI